MPPPEQDQLGKEDRVDPGDLPEVDEHGVVARGVLKGFAELGIAADVQDALEVERVQRLFGTLAHNSLLGMRARRLTARASPARAGQREEQHVDVPSADHRPAAEQALLAKAGTVEHRPRRDVLRDDAGLHFLEVAFTERLLDDGAERLRGVAMAAPRGQQAVADLADARRAIVDAQRDPAQGDLRAAGAEQPLEAADRARTEVLRARAHLPLELLGTDARDVLIAPQVRTVQHVPQLAG